MLKTQIKSMSERSDIVREIISGNGNNMLRYYPEILIVSDSEPNIYLYGESFNRIKF